MRIEFMQVESRYQARKSCVWVAITMKVTGGYICYESIEDYRVARNQR